MENPKAKPSFTHIFKKSVLELERVFLNNIPLLLRFERQILEFSTSLFGSRLG